MDNPILNYKKMGEGEPLVILHGMLGSLDNWQSLAKRFAADFTVYIVDQRNHGRSFHSNSHTYQDMVNDLLRLFDFEQIDAAHIIGHSMGGKTAMSFAAGYPDKVMKLIIVDITPGDFSDKHANVFEALAEVDTASVQSREDVKDFLSAKLNDEGTAQFLSKSLYRTDANVFAWRFNLSTISNYYSAVASAIPQMKVYEGPTLFIKGQRSGYITPANYSSITDVFPHHELEEVEGAGHWIHAEQPELFYTACMKFLKE